MRYWLVDIDKVKTINKIEHRCLGVIVTTEFLNSPKSRNIVDNAILTFNFKQK
jgi:hypothetical protein